MLPLELMVHALEAEVIDAIIAPSPWGLQIESQAIGKMDLRTSPGKFAQRLAVVGHKDFLENDGGLINTFPERIAAAREHLKDSGKFGHAVGRMAQNGKSAISEDLMKRAGSRHAFSTLTHDIVPDAHTLVAELARLAEFSASPAQVGQGEQTARLLLCS
jgi:ABC-type nitrate/sulfonate/bicarbonate transport system substrate-binding protein